MFDNPEEKQHQYSLGCEIVHIKRLEFQKSSSHLNKHDWFRD